jgi:hypothetical protein
MSWEKGRYYTRSRRVNGRIVREYLGCGPIAHAEAEIDRLELEFRRQRRFVLKCETRELHAVRQELAQWDRICKHFLEVELETQGYYQHKRGEWRKRRKPLTRGKSA